MADKKATLKEPGGNDAKFLIRDGVLTITDGAGREARYTIGKDDDGEQTVISQHSGQRCVIEHGEGLYDDGKKCHTLTLKDPGTWPGITTYKGTKADVELLDA